jgi:hypothetical protein
MSGSTYGTTSERPVSSVRDKPVEATNLSQSVASVLGNPFLEPA